MPCVFDVCILCSDRRNTSVGHTVFMLEVLSGERLLPSVAPAIFMHTTSEET